MIPNLCLFFLYFQWLLSFQQFCHFSLNKSCKTYLGAMLPLGGRNWQLISPHFNNQFLQCAKVPALINWHKRCCYVSSTFLLKFYYIIQATDFMQRTIFLSHFDQMFLPLKLQKLFFEKLLCFWRQNVDEIEGW